MSFRTRDGTTDKLSTPLDGYSSVGKGFTSPRDLWGCSRSCFYFDVRKTRTPTSLSLFSGESGDRLRGHGRRPVVITGNG